MSYTIRNFLCKFHSRYFLHVFLSGNNETLKQHLRLLVIAIQARNSGLPISIKEVIVCLIPNITVMEDLYVTN